LGWNNVTAKGGGELRLGSAGWEKESQKKVKRGRKKNEGKTWKVFKGRVQGS